MNGRAWMSGAGLVVAAGVVLAASIEAAEPEIPTCGTDEALVWAPHGRVDPDRKRACQA